MTIFRGLFLLLFLSSPLLGAPDQVVRRVHAYLTVQDPRSAVQEAYQGVLQYPNEKGVWEAYLYALAKGGEDRVLVQVWNDYKERFYDAAYSRTLVETIAWGILEKGGRSSSPLVRSITLLGASFSNDAKGVALLANGLKDPNHHVRGVSVKLVSSFRDAQLQEKILELLKEEEAWNVRMEVIHATGKMGVKPAIPELLNLIGNPKTMAEEKAVAIESLVNLLDTVKRDQIETLANSNRAGLRELACQVVAYFTLKSEIDLLLPLLSDHSAAVRVAAIEAMGLSRVTHVKEQSIPTLLMQMTRDPDDTVAVTAAWALTLHHPEKGGAVFDRFFLDSPLKTKRLAAAALSATGKYGLPHLKRAFSRARDPFVRRNLAIGLLTQRERTEAACQVLHKGLTEDLGRWVWRQKGVFKVLLPLKGGRGGSPLQTPEFVNLMTRLEVVNLLAIVQYPYAQEAIKRFLLERPWGISGVAASVLLTEGNEEALDLIKPLLDDPQKKIRVQAALILALWGRGEEAVQTLQTAYAESDRELKEHILEGLGQIGSPVSIPFLAERLQEQSQTLRLIAAASLLRTLYN